MDKKAQYRQIDYIKLFKLCKDMGIIKRKRKMPADYEKKSSQISSCKRIFKEMLEYLFPDFTIKNDSNIFFMTVPGDIAKSLNFINSQPSRYFTDLGEEGAEAQRKFNLLKQQRVAGEHIIPYFPYEVRINVASNDGVSKYARLKQQGVSNPNRPIEDFYRCAVGCVEYKKIWDENIKSLVSFISRAEEIKRQRDEQIKRERTSRREAERQRLLQEKIKIEENEEVKKKMMAEMVEKKRIENERKAEEERQRMERERANVEQLRRLEEQTEIERQNRVANAQSLFNNALVNFRSKNGN